MPNGVGEEHTDRTPACEGAACSPAGQAPAGKDEPEKLVKADGFPIGLAATVTLVVGVFAAVGVSGDYLPRLVRDQPGEVSRLLLITIIGATVIAIAATIGAFPSNRQRWWHHFARVFAGFGAIVVLFAAYQAVNLGTKSINNREQPRVALSAETTDNGVTITVDASGSGLRPADNMLVQVIGLKDLADPLIGERETCEQSQLTTALNDSQSQDKLLVWEQLGPDVNGTAHASIKVVVAVNEFKGACAFGALADKGLATADLNTRRATATYIRLSEKAADP